MPAQSGSVLFAAVAFLCCQPLAAQDSTPPLLPLNQAVQLAVANNRRLKIANLEVDKLKWEVAETKTKRLPAFSTYLFGSQLLNEVSFTFQQGVFGTFPDPVGPIPGADTKITTPRRPTMFAVAQVAQPLTQLYKIGLGIRAQELSTDITSEKYRAERQGVIKDVKQAYYAVLQSESAIEATEASVKQFQELDRLTQQYLAQEVVLKSERLEVKAKLAQEEYKLIQLRNGLQSQKEYLNDLLGREISTDFRTEPVPALSAIEVDLKAAQATALAQRPEVKQAELSTRQAEYDRRMAKAEYIPDVGLAFHYLSPFNVDFVPKNIASVGLELKWEPFDWGRRRDVINQKQITLEESQAQLLNARTKVLLDVNQRFRKLEESRALLNVAQTARDAAQEKLREVTNRFEQKAVLLRDLLQQQAAVSGANSDYQQALSGFWSARAEFETALGED